MIEKVGDYQTLLDKKVRNTQEITPDQFNIKFNQQKFNKMLDNIKNDMGLPENSKLKGYLHNMLIYTPGQFFKKHQDKIVAVAVRGKLGLIGIHWGIYETSDEFQIMGLFVKKGWRKFGYARMLKSYLEDNLLCGTRISTQVDITNIKMNNLNLSSGYMPSKIGNNQTTYFKVI